MRIGAIFARGSCRALKRMALFGVVFALGAAQAAAQVTVTTPKTVDEGGRLTLSVSAKISVGPGLAAPTSITITPTVAARSAVSAGDEASLTAAEVAAGLTVADAADFDAPVPAALALVVQPHPTGGTADAVNRTLTGTITVQTRPDLDAEDEGIQVTYAVVNADAVNVTAQGGAALALDADSTDAQKVTISDTDDQVFEWKLTTDSPKESGAVNVTLTADPTPVDRLHVTAISVDKAGYTVDTSSHTFGNEVDATSGDDGPMASIAITPPNPDGDRDTDTITLRALMGGTNIDRATPLEIEVADIHGLPMADKITATAFTIDDMDKKTEDEAMSIMEGGDPVYVTVTVDRGEMGYPSGEALAVSVTADPSQALDYRVDPPEVTIASGTGKKSADFMLWAAADDDVGMEDLMLYLTAKGATAKNGSGEVMGMFSIAIEDATTPLVSVKDGAYDAIMTALGDDPLNPGDEVTIMTDDLFAHDDDMVSVSFGTSVEGASVGASASGEAVTVTAMEPGEAEVTVSATATPRSSSLVVTQERANVARLTFPVSVVLSELSVAVTADPMEIMEGGTSTITATASREVAASDVTWWSVWRSSATASSRPLPSPSRPARRRARPWRPRKTTTTTRTSHARGAGDGSTTTTRPRRRRPRHREVERRDLPAAHGGRARRRRRHVPSGRRGRADAGMMFDAAGASAATRVGRHGWRHVHERQPGDHDGRRHGPRRITADHRRGRAASNVAT